MKLYIAHYQPMLSDGQKDPSRRGFVSEDAAWRYICDKHVCNYCLEDIKLNLHSMYQSNDSDDIVNRERTGCAAEWLVLTEEAFDKAETHMDLMKAAGWKEVKLKKKAKKKK